MICSAAVTYFGIQGAQKHKQKTSERNGWSCIARTSIRELQDKHTEKCNIASNDARTSVLHIAAPTHFDITFVTSTSKNIIITVEKRFI